VTLGERKRGELYVNQGVKEFITLNKKKKKKTKGGCSNNQGGPEHLKGGGRKPRKRRFFLSLRHQFRELRDRVHEQVM